MNVNIYATTELDNIRRNSSQVKQVWLENRNLCSISNIPNHCELLGEALEGNTHVESLVLKDWRPQDSSVDKLLQWIETSKSLKRLTCDVYVEVLLEAISKRTRGLDLLKLKLWYADPETLQSIATFLRTTPKIATFKFFLDLWEYDDEYDRIPFPQGHFQAVIEAAPVALIESLHVNEAFPWQILEAFKLNSNLKQVNIKFFESAPSYYFEVIRACRYANFDLSLRFVYSFSFNNPNDWLPVARELEQYDSLKTIIFEDTSWVEDELFIKDSLLPTLFQGTQRKLTLDGCSGGVMITEGIVEKMATTIYEIDLHTMKDALFRHLMLALAKPTSVVHSLHVKLTDQEDAIIFIQNFSSVWSVKQARVNISFEAGFFKKHIVKAIGRNRSVTKEIQLSSFDSDSAGITDGDRAFVKWVVQRNRYLPELLQPQQLMQTNPALLPFTFEVALKTDRDDFFNSFRSLDFAFMDVVWPDKSEKS